MGFKLKALIAYKWSLIVLINTIEFVIGKYRCTRLRRHCVDVLWTIADLKNKR